MPMRRGRKAHPGAWGDAHGMSAQPDFGDQSLLGATAPCGTTALPPHGQDTSPEVDQTQSRPPSPTQPRSAFGSAIPRAPGTAGRRLQPEPPRPPYPPRHQKHQKLQLFCL